MKKLIFFLLVLSNLLSFSKNIFSEEIKLKKHKKIHCEQFYKNIEKCRLELIHNPKSSLLYSQLATQYFKIGHFSLAMQTAQKALQINSKSIEARMIVASLYNYLKNFSLALKEYQFILSIDPRNEEALIQRIRILDEQGKNNQIIKELSLFTKKNPYAYKAFFGLARAYYQLAQYNQAIKACKTILLLSPNFLKAHFLLGKLYELKNCDLKALEVYQALFESTHDLIAAEYLVKLYFKKKTFFQLNPV